MPAHTFTYVDFSITPVAYHARKLKFQRFLVCPRGQLPDRFDILIVLSLFSKRHAIRSAAVLNSKIHGCFAIAASIL